MGFSTIFFIFFIFLAVRLDRFSIDILFRRLAFMSTSYFLLNSR